MKYENKTKAELAEAYLHCLRVKALLENGGEFNKSYEDLKKESYESLVENFSAVDILCKIKETIRTIEKNMHIAPLEDWWMPTTPNHLMPSIPMYDNNKQAPKPWDDKFMCGSVPKGVIINDPDVNGIGDMVDPRDVKTPIDDGGYPDNQMG